MPKIRPLETRPFRFKNATKKFHCPLCASERYLTSSHRMTSKQFIQIAVLTGVTTFALYDYFGLRSLVFGVLYWAAYEIARRLVFRSEIECPYCGFDASWYKRDVKVARRLVDEFWQKKNAPTDKTPEPPQANL